MDLRCGSLGVEAEQKQAVEVAAKYGFESVKVLNDHGLRFGMEYDPAVETTAAAMKKALALVD